MQLTVIQNKIYEIRIMIIRTFVLIREFALSCKDLYQKIAKLEKKYNSNFKEIFHALNLLLSSSRKISQKENGLVLKKINR